MKVQNLLKAGTKLSSIYWIGADGEETQLRKNQGICLDLTVVFQDVVMYVRVDSVCGGVSLHKFSALAGCTLEEKAEEIDKE